MIRIKLLLLSIIILLLWLSYNEPIVYCEVNNTEYEAYIKDIFINCLLDIVKDDIFIKHFGISNSFYITQINEQFIRDFINNKETLAIIFDKSLITEQIFKSLYELFYDYVKEAQQTYIRNRFSILIPELSKIITYIGEYYKLYNFIHEKDLNVENVIRTEGFKYLYEKEQRKKLSKILLSILNINATMEGDNREFTINIRLFIFEYKYTYKYK